MHNGRGRQPIGGDESVPGVVGVEGWLFLSGACLQAQVIGIVQRLDERHVLPSNAGSGYLLTGNAVPVYVSLGCAMLCLSELSSLIYISVYIYEQKERISLYIYIGCFFPNFWRVF